MTTRTLAIPAAAVALLTACGTPSPGAIGDWNVLTSEQMLAANAPSVYAAVERLRPDWITTRGPTSLTNATPAVPTVFIAGNEVGDIQYLRGLNVEDVAEVRYYEAGEASARFGMGHQRGVIDVIMKGSDGSP